jgi:predicted flap endonuclease-1-like 5' DNA nuclease
VSIIMAETEAVTLARVPETSAPDDLTRIEGIGLKISGLPQAAGITTFAQLAATKVSRLDQIVRDAGITLVDASTWPTVNQREDKHVERV